MWGGKHFTDYRTFPAWSGQPGPAGVSHAAGRYQFEPATWRGQAAKLHLADFSPVSQDIAAWDLAATVYRSRTGRDLLKDLTVNITYYVASALNSTWTSLASGTFTLRFEKALKAINEKKPIGTPPVVKAADLPPVPVTPPKVSPPLPPIPELPPAPPARPSLLARILGWFGR